MELVLLVGGLFVGLWIFVGRYNRLQALAQLINENRSNIENSLSTRADLVTQLFEIAKENGVHETQIQTAVAQLEKQPGGLPAAGMQGVVAAMAPITRTYPKLKANKGYDRLMSELRIVEDRILARRDQYNSTVREYNTAINSLPTLLYARAIGFGDAPYYDNDDPASLALFQAASGEKMRDAVFNVSSAYFGGC